MIACIGFLMGTSGVNGLITHTAFNCMANTDVVMGPSHGLERPGVNRIFVYVLMIII